MQFIESEKESDYYSQSQTQMNELQYLIVLIFKVKPLGIYRTYDDCTRARAYAWPKGQYGGKGNLRLKPLE